MYASMICLDTFFQKKMICLDTMWKFSCFAFTIFISELQDSDIGDAVETEPILISTYGSY